MWSLTQSFALRLLSGSLARIESTSYAASLFPPSAQRKLYIVYVQMLHKSGFQRLASRKWLQLAQLPSPNASGTFLVAG